jgi:hypothetical protein
MELSNYLKMLYSYVGDGKNEVEYMRELFDHLIDDTHPDVVNPLYDLTPDYLNRIYNGRAELAKSRAAKILSNLDELKYANFINEKLTIDANTNLKKEIDSFDLKLENEEVPEQCGEIIVEILKEISRKTKRKGTSESVLQKEKTELSKVPLPSVFVKDSKIYIGNQSFNLHNKIEPPSEIEPVELPYIEALLSAYAHAEHLESVTKESLPDLPKKYIKNFIEQRENYYNIDSIFHSVREVFEDGEEDFNRLKEDTYDGISDTCWEDYSDGYKRLIAVLRHATVITLSKSYLSQITNLIGNSEKKGICHLLVNDGKIKWVMEYD